MTWIRSNKKSSGGGSGDLDALIDGSIISITSNASSIRDYAFYDCKSLKTASFPNATSIGKYSFGNTSSTYNILESINAPNVTTIGLQAFLRNRELKEIDFPKITNIGETCFYNCSKIKSVNLPNVTSIGLNMFSSCTNAITINLPKVTTLQQGTFNSCTKLKNVDVSSATNVARTAFQSTGLEVLDLPKVTIINEQGFTSSTYLATIILRSETVATLDNISAFNNTPFASGKAGGTLYVPQALITSYQSANNWSTILGYPNNSIQAIEGSIYE